MSKYSCEFKKEIVMAYINGEGGYGYLVNKYGVKSSTNIVKWVKAYKEFGDDGLIRSRQNNTFEFKLSVVELYLTTEISYQELAIQVDMNNPPLITKWLNDYRIAGPDSLREKSKGRNPIVPKPKNYSFDELKSAIEEYIEYYNTKRTKQVLDFILAQ